MKTTVFILMIITVLSKAVGFSRDIILSYFYGASNVSDAYLISITIPMVIFGFIGTGISTGYIPIYSKIETNGGIEEGNRFTNNLVNILLVICTIIFILGLVFTQPIVKIFAAGFEGDTMDLAVKFTKISLIGIYFSGLIYIFSGFLQIKGNYIIPALIGFPLNFFYILSIIISSKGNILVLSIGSVIAAASQLLLLIPFSHKKGYRYKFIVDIKDKNIKNMVYIALPVILGVSVNQINVLVDRTLASSIAIGGISALNYANRLNLFIQGIFVMPLVTVMYPIISKMAAEDNITGLKKSVSEVISGISILVIPATIGAMVLAKPVVQLLFGRGAFDSRAIDMTSYAFFFYSIGMLGYGLREVLSRVFYSLQDTRTPMINAALGMTLNIILNIILSRFLGIGGLALATSIAAILTMLLLLISLRKKIGPCGIKKMYILLFKVVFSSLVMGLIVKLCFNYLSQSIFSQNLSLIISIGVGVMSYFTIIYLMKIDEIMIIVNNIKAKVKGSAA